MSAVIAGTHLAGTSTLILRDPFSDPDGDLRIQRVDQDRILDELVLPCPRHGFAGASFVLSNSGRFVVLSMYSGQSEEGYELLTAVPLSRVGGLPYVFGYLSAFAFRADDSGLVMARLHDCSPWWSGWENELERGKDGDLYFPLGGLHLHDINSGEIASSELVARVSGRWCPPAASSAQQSYVRPSFVPAGIGLDASWGQRSIEDPPPATVIVGLDGHGNT